MDCNLDLRLSQPPASTPPRRYFNPQQLAIICNGRLCVCDVAEIQARAIIWQASKQVEQGRYNDCEIRRISPDLDAYNSAIAVHRCNASPMKKSLQRFLQERKHRQLAASVYSNGKR